jgi:hypothetical protein
MISVAIIARNKSEILPACLASAQEISDDVVVVTNVDHKFINYANQKNYATSLCKHTWVFSLDADEIISSDLIQEIKSLDLENSSFAAYKIPRLNIIFGKPILHTNWDPQSDSHIWLFDKTKCSWVGDVHEEIFTKGLVGNLIGHKIHYNYTTVEQFITKLNGYTSLEKGTKNPVYEFLRRYLWHKGYLDGWHGFLLSYLMGFYYLVAFVKQWQKKNSG